MANVFIKLKRNIQQLSGNKTVRIMHVVYFENEYLTVYIYIGNY